MGVGPTTLGTIILLAEIATGSILETMGRMKGRADCSKESLRGIRRKVVIQAKRYLQKQSCPNIGRGKGTETGKVAQW